MICCACGGIAKIRLKAKNTDVYRCADCALLFVHPVPEEEEIAAYYRGFYSNEVIELDESRIATTTKTVASYSEAARRIRGFPISTMMDYGGGLGYFCKAAQSLGIDATLVDPDPVSISFARERLQVSNTHLIDATQQFSLNKRFDFILLRHVIEHVKDPHALLRRCRQHLAPNGLLWIETDNNDSVELLMTSGTRRYYRSLYQRKFGQLNLIGLLKLKVFAIDPPRHLFAFRMQNLSIISRSIKMEPVLLRSYMLGDELYWPNVKLANVKTLYLLLLKGKKREALNVILDYIVLPVRIINNWLGKGAGIQVVLMMSEEAVSE